MLGAPYRPFSIFNLKPTPLRAANLVANKLSRKLRAETAWLYPHRVDLELTNLCNLGCQMCATGIGSLPRDRMHLSFERFKSALEPAFKSLTLVQLAGYGEPFLNKQAFDIVDELKARGIYTDIYTNILPLQTEGMKRLIAAKADRITVSLDSIDQKTYFEYKRREGYQETLDKLRELASLKKSARARFPLINFQFVVMKLNSEQLEPARKLALELGVDTFSPKTANLRISSEEWRAKKLSSPLAGFHRAHETGKRYSCPWIWDGFILFVNGDIGPCCYDSLGEHVFGNAFEQGVLNVWNGDKFRAFRKAFVANDNHTRLCAACTVKFKM